MRQLIILTSILAAACAASAYDAGTYTCPGRGHLPANIYVVKKIAVGGETLPYLELTRHFVGGGNGEVETALMRGFAIESNLRGKTTLSIASVSLELEAGSLKGCSFLPAERK